MTRAELMIAVSRLWCAHEWARRVDGRRLYLECVRCERTTPGIDTGKPARWGTVVPMPHRKGRAA